MKTELLHKYFRGETTEKEENQIVEWTESSAENKERFLKERMLFDITLFSDDSKIQRKPKGHLYLYPLIAIAAMLAIVFVMDLPHMHKPKQQLSQTIRIPAGQRAQMDLPDGSIVWLNSQTTLTYDENFGKKDRKVTLDGEAYFEVAKDANRPFIVHTDHFATRVLGTSFDVTTAPRADGSSAVVLVEGSVAIDVADGESVTLNPSERFSMKDGSYSVYEVDPYKYISWKDGLLFFTSNTLFEVLQKVAAFYKIEITCSGEIGSRKCTGKLILFDDLDGTLDVLSDIFRIAYVRGPDGSVAVRPAPDDCADAVYR